MRSGTNDATLNHSKWFETIESQILQNIQWIAIQFVCEVEKKTVPLRSSTSSSDNELETNHVQSRSLILSMLMHLFFKKTNQSISLEWNQVQVFLLGWPLLISFWSFDSLFKKKTSQLTKTTETFQLRSFFFYSALLRGRGEEDQDEVGGWVGGSFAYRWKRRPKRVFFFFYLLPLISLLPFPISSLSLFFYVLLFFYFYFFRFYSVGPSGLSAYWFGASGPTPAPATPSPFTVLSSSSSFSFFFFIFFLFFSFFFLATSDVGLFSAPI